jgi:hypothetical protein
MRRSELFRGLVGAAFLPMAAGAQPWLTQEGDLWVRTFHETAAAKPRVRINAHGPVTLEGNVSPNFDYTVKVAVRARTREQARILLEKAELRMESQTTGWCSPLPAGDATASVTMRAPRLREAIVSSSDGAVEVTESMDPLTWIPGGPGEGGPHSRRLHALHGRRRYPRGNGRRVSPLHHRSGRDYRQSGARRSSAADQRRRYQCPLGGRQRARGNRRRHGALGTVNGPVTAINGGGPIIVDLAAGIVTTRDMAGPVTVRRGRGHPLRFGQRRHTARQDHRPHARVHGDGQHRGESRKAASWRNRTWRPAMVTSRC